MFNLFQRRVSKDVSGKLQFLLSSQYWTLEQIREYQWIKLQALIRHAVINVPYYRELFSRFGLKVEDIMNLEDFSKIPILTKGDLQRNFNKMVAKGVDTRFLPLNSTGGSTGMPLNFYQDTNYVQWSDAARLRSWRYMVGADGNDLEAVFWGAVRDIGKGLTLQQVLRGYLRERALLLNTFDLDEKLLKKYLRYYNIFKPKIIRGYASSLYYVARYIEKSSIIISKPMVIISTTEILHARMRDSIERVFGCKVIDSYGCREVSQIATECESHCGLHVVFENQYVELDGKDIIITNLNNYVMPFIRYRVGDLAEKIDTTSCSCGRNSPRIINLIGRDNDNIELPNGKIINGEFFEFLFFGISSVIQYQVIYDRSLDKLLVKLHLSGDPDDVGSLIQTTMKDKFDFSNVSIEYNDKFDKTPTGKLRFVYSIN